MRPVDHDTRRPWHWHLDCYGVEPRVITWDGRFDSAIDAEGGHSRLRRGWKSAWGHPIRNPKGLIWNLKKLGLTWWLWCFLKNTKLRIGRELARAQTKLGALTIKTATMTDNDSGGEN